MRLMRVGDVGAERPVLALPDGTHRDLSGITADIDGAFLAADGIARIQEAQPDLPTTDITGLELAARRADIGQLTALAGGHDQQFEILRPQFVDSPRQKQLISPSTWARFKF